MKQYPSIPNINSTNKAPYGEPCVGFYKYDGSNLRWEWNKKRGFYKYGSRTQLFDESHEMFSQAIPIFQDTIAPTLIQIVKDNYKVDDFLCYTEFFGESSFAGWHDLSEEKKLILLDVWIPHKGFIIPKTFNKMFSGHEWSPKVVYEGNFNKQLCEDVKSGKYDLDEGMMCKGVDNKGQQWMIKMKTQTYLDKLKNKYGNDWEKYV